MTQAGDRPPAILLGGEAIALSVARSLAREGVPVYGLGHELDPLRVSRARVEFVPVGNGRELQRLALSWLEDVGPRRGVVIPCDDEPLDLIARERSRIESWGYAITESTDSGIRAMLDKRETYGIADQAGVATPRWAPLPEPERALELVREIGYPCAIKPAVSHEWARRFPLRTKALTAQGPAELEAAIGEVADVQGDLMLVELIPGGDDAYWSYYSYRAPDGRRLGGATKRKIRQYPPGLGQSTLNVLEWDEGVADAGWRLIEAGRLEGIAYVEFKRDPRDGGLRLIECNHRAVGPSELFAKAGHDLAMLAYRRALGEDPEPLERPHHDGAGLIWPGLDTRAALASVRAGNLSVSAWLRGLIRPLRLPIFALSDPKPSLTRFLRKVAARLPGRGA